MWCAGLASPGSTNKPSKSRAVHDFSSSAKTSSTASNFTAIVNWGDSTAPTAGYVSGASGSFTVTGGHLYATTGSYTTTITVIDLSGTTASGTATATVSAPPATLTASNVSATEGASYTNSTLASFTPASGTSGHTFVASLGWGDGAVTYGTLTSNGS